MALGPSGATATTYRLPSMSSAFAALQRLLPQHGLTRSVGWLAKSETRWLKNAFIKGFVRAYAVDLAEAINENPTEYESFNAFFTRALKPGRRPMPDAPLAIACPADGTISQSGAISGNSLLQAKGTRYSLDSLAHDLGAGFDEGSFVTVYLAPHNYHRVHLPSSSTLTATRSIPGALFSVNAKTEASVADLFCRNERLVCRFSSQWGDMLVVLVGALIVGRIETAWPGPRSRYRQTETNRFDLPLERGVEIGRFLLGSTVIVCLPPGRAELSAMTVGQSVRMGESIGHWRA